MEVQKIQEEMWNQQREEIEMKANEQKEKESKRRNEDKKQVIIICLNFKHMSFCTIKIENFTLCSL
jgi:negative regulator of genetic competence, sporulation and motility